VSNPRRERGEGVAPPLVPMLDRDANGEPTQNSSLCSKKPQPYTRSVGFLARGAGLMATRTGPIASQHESQMLSLLGARQGCATRRAG